MARHRWKKLGLTFPLLELDRPTWMNSHAQSPATLELSDRIRIYFSTRQPADSDGRFVSNVGFADFSKKDPTQLLGVSQEPVIPLGGRGRFDEFGIYPWSVIRADDKIRAYFGGWTRPTSTPFNVGIGVAESSDGGLSFKRLGQGPVLSYSPDEPFVLSSPRIRKFGAVYYLFYIAGSAWVKNGERLDPIYRIRGARSDDGLCWTKFNIDLIQPVLPGEAQASPDVFWHDGEFHMFFCFRHGVDFHRDGRGYRIGYATSKDLMTWNRNDSDAGLSRALSGFDSEMVSYPHHFFIGPKRYLAYLGNDFGRAGFGLAELESAI